MFIAFHNSHDFDFFINNHNSQATTTLSNHTHRKEEHLTRRFGRRRRRTAKISIHNFPGFYSSPSPHQGEQSEERKGMEVNPETNLHHLLQRRLPGVWSNTELCLRLERDYDDPILDPREWLLLGATRFFSDARIEDEQDMSTVVIESSWVLRTNKFSLWNIIESMSSWHLT